MFIIKVIDLSTKDKKYKHQKYRPLEIEKKVFFSYFISEIPHFSYKCFFRKCSMFCGSIPLISCHVDMSFIKQTGQNNKILLLSRSYIKRFVWYNLHDSQSALRFSLCLHYHTSCSYWVVKFVHTAYSIFRSLNAMSEKQAAAAIIIALLWKKKKKKKKRKSRQKRKVWVKPWLKSRQSLGVYETLLAGLQLQDECNYKNYLRMTSENFKEIFQLIKDVLGMMRS